MDFSRGNFNCFPDQLQRYLDVLTSHVKLEPQRLVFFVSKDSSKRPGEGVIFCHNLQLFARAIY